MLNQIEQQLIKILSSKKSVGLLASGGFDSTVLLYLCIGISRRENLYTKIRIFTVPRHDGSIDHAIRIVNWMNKKFNTKLNITLVGDPDLHHSRQVLSGLMDAERECDYLLLGDTTNPEHLLNGPDRIKSPVDQFVQPFFDFTKKDIVKLAQDIGFHEAAEIAHTCTESKLLRCNNCWQCQERAWAFKANNIVDPGTM